MSDYFQISAKRLGELEMPTFCPRCFWLRAHSNWQEPWNKFPKVFNLFDRYQKAITDFHLDTGGCATAWMKEIGDVVGRTEPPTFRTFRMVTSYGTVLTGSPDYILNLRNGDKAIVDFKTSLFHGQDDFLLPIYRIQLAAYASLAQATGLGNVSKLALVYFEPLAGAEQVQNKAHHLADGYLMKFSPKILEVALDPDRVLYLLKMATEIYNLRKAPCGRIGCPDCKLFDDMGCLINGGTNPFSQF